MGIGDHQLDPSEAALHQALEEGRPECLRFGGTDPEADDLAAAVGVGGDGYYRGHRDDAAALAHLEVSGIEPEIGPVALERAVEEGADPLVDLLAELRDLALGDAGQAHRLHQVVHPPGGDAGDPCLLYDRHQRLLGRPTSLQERREVAALAELRNP
jgi:hypothetical protein